jgi:hypothetical protein
MQQTFRWQPCLRVAREGVHVSWLSGRCKFARISDRGISPAKCGGDHTCGVTAIASSTVENVVRCA